MALTKINGYTYYYPAPTNVGVFRYKNGLALLVDAGIDSTAGRALAQAVEGEGLKPKYVVFTHSHPDHYGAGKWLKGQYSGLLRYAAAGEAVWMANPDLESKAIYGARPLRELEGRLHKGPVVEIDFPLGAGEVEIGDKRFQIISLPGHTYHHTGVLTGDGVLFAGDSLFSEETMAKYRFPFLFDIEQQLATIDRLAALQVEYVVLSHGAQVYSNISSLCQQNKDRIDYYLNLILDLCNQPLTREDVTEQVLNDAQMEVDVVQYHVTLVTVGAFLSYLANRQQIAKSVIGGKCYFYRE